MIKDLGASVLAVGYVTCCLSLSTPQLGAEPLQWDGSLNSAVALSMFYGEHAPVPTEIGQMGHAPLNLFPTSLPAPMNAAASAPARTAGFDPSKDSPTQITPVQRDPIYCGGEVGVFYGHSSGKFGGDDFGSYLVGTVGNDKFQITAGASYDESNFHLPRRIR